MNLIDAISQLSSPVLKTLAKDLLNNAFNLKLTSSITKHFPGDFVELNNDGSIKTVVEVIGPAVPELRRREAISNLIKASFDKFKAEKFILLSFSELISSNSVDFIVRLEPERMKDVVMYDIRWVQQQLSENKDIATKYGLGISEIDLTSTKFSTSLADKLNKDSQRVNNLIKGRRFYAVGFDWDGESQIERFYQGGFWEKGNIEKGSWTINSLEIGDWLILKSSFQRSKVSTLRVKGVGIVTGNKFDGKRVQVKWFPIQDLDIKGLGAYRSTISQINDTGNISEILLQILTKAKSVFHELERFIPSNKRQVGLRKYWWFNFGPDTFDQEYFGRGFAPATVATFPVDLNQKWKEEDRPRIYDWVICFKVPERELMHAVEIDSNITFNSGENTVSLIFRAIEGKNLPRNLDDFKEKDLFKKAGIEYSAILPQEISKDLYEILSGAKILSETETTRSEGDFDPNDFNTGKLDETEEISKAKERIPFHLDQVIDEDKLGRDPVAKAFADLIKKDIFTSDLKNHSFIVHLQGEWGAGKSTFIKLIQKHLNSSNDKWIFAEYNAWENQHLSPPWWTLIDQIYRSAKPQLGWYDRVDLFLCENYRRIIRYTGRQLLISFILSLFFLASIFLFHDSIINFVQGLISSEKSIEWNAQLYIEFLILGGTLVASIHAFSKFLSTPLFLGSQSDAQSFLKRSSDPMSNLKKHFNGLVDDINNPFPSERRQLVVFIDDIDRCHRKFIVELLEGIQTLFKEKRVLYIVAGQKDWIVKSFTNTYSEFGKKDDDGLGELFLEKAFQLSIRVPKISESYMKSYWRHILGVTQEQQRKLEELDETSKAEFLKEIKTSTEDISNPEYMNSVQTRYNLDSDSVTNAVIEKMNDEKEELRHLLIDLHRFVKPNPRSIIRLANRYTMTRSTLTAERQSVSPEKIFRWLVIEDLIPAAKYEPLTNMEALLKFVSNQKEIDQKLVDNSLILLEGSNNEFSEPLSIEEIKIITGK